VFRTKLFEVGVLATGIIIVGALAGAWLISQFPETPTAGERREFKITAKQWEFNPSRIEVNKGEVIRLNITSMDVTHGFAIPAFGVDVRLDPGKSVIVEFVASKTGDFPFFCTIFCGEGHSDMIGTLVVR